MSKEDFLQSVVVAAYQYHHIYRDVDSSRWIIILREMNPTDFADLLAFPHFWLFDIFAPGCVAFKFPLISVPVEWIQMILMITWLSWSFHVSTQICQCVPNLFAQHFVQTFSVPKWCITMAFVCPWLLVPLWGAHLSFWVTYLDNYWINSH